MIGVKDQDYIIDQVVDGVLHPDYPSNFNIVIPPGFGEERIAAAIHDRIKRHASNPMVASISSASLYGGDSYVMDLHSQWSAVDRLYLPPREEDTNSRLRRFIDSLPLHRPAVQVLTHFEKILKTLDQWILGTLRLKEQNRQIRSIIFSPYPYVELKDRWRADGHFFCTSDYGDTHRIIVVEPMAAQAILEATSQAGIPEYVSRHAIFLTGGYPDAFGSVIAEWQRSGKPSLKPQVQKALRSVAEKGVRRFVNWLDPQGETKYCECISALVHGERSENSLFYLSRHPWKEALLLDNELRAECVGSVAFSRILENESQTTQHGIAWERALTLYRLKQFASANELVARIPPGSAPPHLEVLRAHTRIMSLLYCGDSDQFSVDIQWKQLTEALDVAHRMLGDCDIDQTDRLLVLDRYTELDKLAGSIVQAMKEGCRIVDILAGIGGRNSIANPKSAVLLLSAHFQAGKAIKGNASACQFVLPLPEQIFRVWAFLKVGINYYQSPTGSEDLWCEVEPFFGGRLRIPLPNQEFGSFELFAYFALAMFRKLNPSEVATFIAPEADLPTLQKSLSIFEVRRDGAHSLALPNERLKKRYFEVIERWLDAAIAACPGSLSRRQLLDIVAPLPLPDSDGVLTW